MIFCFPDGGDGVVRARIVNRPGESGDRHVVVTFMDDQRTTLRAHADAMNPWAARRLFPSEEYGCEPHQELNAWAVVTTAVSGVAAFAAPAALAAFVPLAVTSGVCLWMTPPYCQRCHQITRHTSAGRTHIRSGAVEGPPVTRHRNGIARFGRAERPVSGPRTRHVFVRRYRCANCGADISRQTEYLR